MAQPIRSWCVTLLVVMCAGCELFGAPELPEPEFDDRTPPYAPNENRFVSRYRARFTVDSQPVTLEFTVASGAIDKPGGGAKVGGVLITNKVRGFPSKLFLEGTAEPSFGTFDLNLPPDVTVSGSLPVRGSASAKLVLKGEEFFGELERLDAPAERDDRVLHVEDASADSNVITGSFPNDLMKYLWLSKGSYAQTVLKLSIRERNEPARSVLIDSPDIAIQSWDGKLHVGAPQTTNPQSPTSITLNQKNADGGASLAWTADQGAAVLDLVDPAYGITLHFEDVVMTPIFSTGATGTFRLRFSGTSTAEQTARNQPDRPSFTP